MSVQTTFPSDTKHSDHAWLGRVPSHWEVLPHRAIFQEIDEKNFPHEEMLSVTIKRGVMRQSDLLSGSAKKDSSRLDKSSYKLVCPGDIAYNKMRAWQGALGKSSFRGIISPAYIVQRLRNSENSPSYFDYLLRTPAFAKEAERWSYGITSDMWSLRPEHFKAIYSVVPPPDEQAAVVRYLDHVTARLDRAIAAKRQVVKLLNEQKQAIIHRAVTRGLVDSAPMKDSGISWLGDVPAHWELKRLKTIFQSVDVRSNTGAEPLLSLKMHLGLVRYHDHNSKPPQAKTLVGFKLVNPGQFVVNRMQAGNVFRFCDELDVLDDSVIGHSFP